MQTDILRYRGKREAKIVWLNAQQNEKKQTEEQNPPKPLKASTFPPLPCSQVVLSFPPIGLSLFFFPHEGETGSYSWMAYTLL